MPSVVAFASMAPFWDDWYLLRRRTSAFFMTYR